MSHWMKPLLIREPNCILRTEHLFLRAWLHLGRPRAVSRLAAEATPAGPDVVAGHGRAFPPPAHRTIRYCGRSQTQVSGAGGVPALGVREAAQLQPLEALRGGEAR
jgi:hypothetical protein